MDAHRNAQSLDGLQESFLTVHFLLSHTLLAACATVDGLALAALLASRPAVLRFVDVSIQVVHF